MGYAKRMLMEEHARRFHTSSDAVCAECFHDSGLTAFIEERLQADTCAVCGRSGKNIAAPADDVLRFILEKIDEEYEDAANSAWWDSEEAEYMVVTYSMHDIVFSECPDIAPYETLEWLYSRLKDDVVYCDHEWQILSPAQALKHSWNSFAESVKHTTRFLFFPKSVGEEQTGEPYLVRPEQMLEELGSVIHQCGLIRTIPRGTRFFRARGHEVGTKYSQPEDLGPPSLDSAQTAGRMNAPGIVVFYGAYDKNTTLAEATGTYKAVSLAEFETLAEMPVVDLTNLPPVPSIFEGGPRESLGFLHQFTQEVSQPFVDNRITRGHVGCQGS